MAYAVYDFSESLGRAEGFTKDDIAECVAAWGYSPEGGGSWTGGFLLRLKDGRHAYLTGWCDYTGWGCHAGASTTITDALPDRSKLDSEGQEWDEVPSDLNRFLRGEIGEFD